MLHIEPQIMNPVFTKYPIYVPGAGDRTFHACIHVLTGPDPEELPHDHCFSYATHILDGWYVEEVYFINPNLWNKGWGKYRREHKAGTVAHYPAKHIHRIIDVSPGGCMTAFMPGHWEQTERHYRFTDAGIFYKPFNETEFKKYHAGGGGNVEALVQ